MGKLLLTQIHIIVLFISFDHSFSKSRKNVLHSNFPLKNMAGRNPLLALRTNPGWMLKRLDVGTKFLLKKFALLRYSPNNKNGHSSRFSSPLSYNVFNNTAFKRRTLFRGKHCQTSFLGTFKTAELLRLQFGLSLTNCRMSPAITWSLTRIFIFHGQSARSAE